MVTLQSTYNEMQMFGKNIISIDPTRSIISQIEDTFLDFFVIEDFIFHHIISTQSYHRIEGKYILKNSRTGEILDIVGKNWNPHQPKNSLQLFENFCHEHNYPITHAGLLDKGRCVFVLADYPAIIDFKGDRTINKLLLSTSNKNGVSTKLDILSYRLVCKNGLKVPTLQNKVTLNHHFAVDKLSESLMDLQDNYAKFEQNLTKFTDLRLSRDEAHLLLIKNFGDPHKPIDQQPAIINICLQLFAGQAKGSDYLSAYNTAYGLLQAVTEYYNHRTRASNTHAYSLLYGAKNQQQQKIYNSLLALV
jgi:hypothetical protein